MRLLNITGCASQNCLQIRLTGLSWSHIADFLGCEALQSFVLTLRGIMTPLLNVFGWCLVAVVPERAYWRLWIAWGSPWLTILARTWSTGFLFSQLLSIDSKVVALKRYGGVLLSVLACCVSGFECTLAWYFLELLLAFRGGRLFYASASALLGRAPWFGSEHLH